MAKTQLTSDWICIATAGYTVDGREITATELTEMAQTYDPNVYTALIWLEHYRYFGNLGRVVEVKVEEVDDKTKLFAKISPTAELLEMNERGQKIFTSVEIMPNFQKSGKCYLYGLAVTDSPASTGTTALNFSTRGIDQNTVFGNAEPLTFKLEENEANFLAFFKRMFGYREVQSKEKIEPSLVDPDNKNNKEEHFSMTKEELAAAIQAGVAAAFTAQAQQNAIQATQPVSQATQTESTPATVSVEDFNTLKEKFEALQEKFNALSQEATPIPNGANPAVVATGNMFNITTAV